MKHDRIDVVHAIACLSLFVAFVTMTDWIFEPIGAAVGLIVGVLWAWRDLRTPGSWLRTLWDKEEP